MNTSTGSVVEEIDYDEFGSVTNDTSPGLTPFGFAGGIYDKDTGLVRFGTRDYDASVGRWTNKDPARFSGGWNLYGYVVNDPVDRTDTGGTGPTCDLARSFANEPRNQRDQCVYTCGANSICAREEQCGDTVTCLVTRTASGQHHLYCQSTPSNGCAQAARDAGAKCKEGCGPKPNACEPGRPDDGEGF